MKYLVILLFNLLLFNCNEKSSKPMNADEIINASIEVSGVKQLDTSVIDFDFRDIHYEAGRFGGEYVFKREFKDSTGIIIDYLSNNNFERRVNDSLVRLSDSLVSLYSASVNSVHYFSVLPYGLDGKAVNTMYLNDVKVEDENYHKIKVTFDQDGGGEDFEDVFIYWVNKETSKIDYLAYSYNEEDGKGFRFRKAYNERFVNGIRFVDYENYKPNIKDIKLENLDDMFKGGQLELVSKIELKNVTVN